MRSLVFLLLIYNYSFGRVNDTLLPRILALQNDTEKVNQLYARGFAIRNSDPQTAFYYAHVCEEQAQISQSKKHLAKSYNLSGILFYRKGDYKKALAYHKKALAIRTEINDLPGTALSETNLGNIYTDLQLFEKAEDSYLKAIETYKFLGDDKRAADCLINLGVLKQTLKQATPAFENYSLALKLGEKLNDYEMRALCLNNIAQVYYDKGDYDKSISYNQDALKIRTLMDNNMEMSDSYLNLAANYIKLKEVEKAKEFLDTAYSTSLRYENYESLQIAYKLYAEYYSEIKKYEEAYTWLKKYETNKDSMLAEQDTYNSEFDFDMPEFTEQTLVAPNHLKNTWLLISVFILGIIIPFFLIRFKR